MSNAIKWGIGTLVLIIFLIAIYLSFRVYSVSYTPGVSIKTQGGNATTNNAVKYTCPKGQVIKFSTNPPPTIIDASGVTECNPYETNPSSSNPFNPNLTQTAQGLIDACEGKEFCTYTLPNNISLGPGPTACGGIDAQIIATYGCVLPAK